MRSHWYPLSVFSVVALALFSNGCGGNDGGEENKANGSEGGSTNGAKGSGAAQNMGGELPQGSGGSPASGGSPGSGGGASSASGGAEVGAGGSGGSGTAQLPEACDSLRYKDADFSTVIEVGEGKDVPDPSGVAWESLAAGTLVKIFARAEPYHDKWVVNGSGTVAKPIVVVGVPVEGKLPVIDGEDAKTRSELDFWNEVRSVIKVGASNKPNNENASNITIECLDIRGAHPDFSFVNAGGDAESYSENAAAITVEQGANIKIINNIIRDSGNGIFTTSSSSNVLVRGNFVHDNGVSGSIYQHNSYTESAGITFEFNHYGPLCPTCPGNNLKDRSAGTVIRFNWIEDGNRQLDLVDTDKDALLNDINYSTTLVHGNVLIEGDGQGNGQIIHYGGDSGDQGFYRKGILHLYNNTIVSTRSGNTTLIRLSSSGETLDARSNIVFVSAPGSNLAIVGETGTATLTNNWLPTGWVESHDTFLGTLTALGTVEGASPGFLDIAAQDFHLTKDSPAKSAGISRASGTPATLFEYKKHQLALTRSEASETDIGAFAQ